MTLPTTVCQHVRWTLDANAVVRRCDLLELDLMVRANCLVGQWWKLFQFTDGGLTHALFFLPRARGLFGL
jgi:hypothetical protein